MTPLRSPEQDQFSAALHALLSRPASSAPSASFASSAPSASPAPSAPPATDGPPSSADPADADPSIRDAVLRSWMGAEAYALATYRTACQLARGRQIGAEASTNKIFWSELDVLMHETAMRILGPRAELLPGGPDAGDVGHWLDGFLFAQAGPIYAGTNEIQRTVIAQRLLGLPR